MKPNEIDAIIEAQRKYFLSGETFNITFRRQMLCKLKDEITNSQVEICEALAQDLGKSETEAYMCEIGMALSEISYMLKHLKGFIRKQRVPTPFAQFPSKSYRLATPYGNVLIMSPWNYPFLLTVGPLVDAIAAGNTAVVKPSAYSPKTAQVIERILGRTFSPEYVAVVSGGREENRHLLEQKFDFVFFTGSQSVGKEVLRHTAEHLTPAVLELGGKSPCIVDQTTKISLAARRIVFGKFLNCGQTCVAPDYVICHKSVKDKLVTSIIDEIKAQYGENPLENENYGKIINEKHFERLINLIDMEKVVFGGERNSSSLKIAPTVMDGVSTSDKVMAEEIFGPILPILTFENIEDVVQMLSREEKPLAFYLFSEDKHTVRELTEKCRFGGGCVNDTVIHLATSEMGFGGVGESGMGSYHGRAGFEAFSHYKSIVKKSTKVDLPMRYMPYGKKTLKLIKFFLK